MKFHLKSLANRLVQIALDTPVDSLFDYLLAEEGAGIGHLAVVPFGKRELMGVILGDDAQGTVDTSRLKEIRSVRTEIPPLSAEWVALCRFAAQYYRRPIGEVALPALPKMLRSLQTVSLKRALKSIASTDSQPPSQSADPVREGLSSAPLLHGAQQEAVNMAAEASGFTPLLLHGVTGSGKTEVYLQAAARVMARAAERGLPCQVLILVPEINLTPQVEAGIRSRFPGHRLATMHSGLSEGERLRHWLAAHLGTAQIVLGTRLAVLASLPHLGLIIVDEEHDPSYKQQEGLRYSARDLAVWRARQLGIPVVLGSATPSLESWHHAQSGRYRLLTIAERAVRNAVLPAVRLVDLEKEKLQDGFSSPLAAAIEKRLQRGEQSLLFLNRRGYAPVIACESCGWVGNCPRCTAFMVWHRPEHRLRCHHCSLEQRIPRACPTCGNVDLQPMGRGTQRIEEGLARAFPHARILRIDADSTRLKGSAQAAFDQVHRGEIDILIGTQMVAKGHDFKRLTLVGVLNPDTALFSHDYRASERLFAQLMQVAGRAGRATLAEDSHSEVLIQTRYPQHPLYGALVAHDYPRFADATLEERRQAGLPPYMFQALLRAEAREIDTALEFLRDAASLMQHDQVTLHDPIPMTVMRVAHVERAQMLVESSSRLALQGFLAEWLACLRNRKSRVRWSLEVDPADI